MSTNFVDLKKKSDKTFRATRNIPAIRSLHLSEGKNVLRPFIQDRFVKPFANSENTEGQERLLKHWWNKGPGLPYTASAILGDLRDGAGQCPPISFFLSWHEIEQLEKKIREPKTGNRQPDSWL